MSVGLLLFQSAQEKGPRFFGLLALLSITMLGCPAAKQAVPCVRTSECNPNQKCLSGFCRNTCQSDRDCAEDALCDKASSLCVVGATPTDAASPDTTPATCGNGKLDPGETCDGTNLSGQDCQKLGFAGGNLSCKSCQLDTSGCSNDPNCGNNRLDPGETCDGTPPAEITCEKLGFTSGTVSCKGCQLDTSTCQNTNTGPTCGNGKIDTGEECDGDQLADQTCKTKGFAGGALTCKSCSFDTSGCQQGGSKKFGEICSFDSDCESLICTRFDATKDPKGYCGAQCDPNTPCPASPSGASCVFSIGAFKLCGWQCIPGQCPSGLKCQAYGGGQFCGADNGNTQTGQCGNNKAETGEGCDGTDLGGKTCKDAGYTGGILKCTDKCSLDTSECTGSTGVKKKYGERCVTPTDCAAGLTCLKIPGTTGSFCTTSCDNGAKCPQNPPNAACILQTTEGKYCGWICVPGSIPCPNGLTCTKISTSNICT